MTNLQRIKVHDMYRIRFVQMVMDMIAIMCLRSHKYKRIIKILAVLLSMSPKNEMTVTGRPSE